MATTAGKRSASQEPLMNAIARKLGGAAGTITKATKELAENLSAIPENVLQKSKTVGKEAGSKRTARGRHATKKTRSTARALTAKRVSTASRKASPGNKRKVVGVKASARRRRTNQK